MLCESALSHRETHSLTARHPSAVSTFSVLVISLIRSRRGARWGLGSVAIGVMQATQDSGRRHAAGTVGCLLTMRDSLRDRLPNPLVRPVRIEIGDIFSEDPSQVPFVQDEQVVEALTADAAQESFANRRYANDKSGSARLAGWWG